MFSAKENITITNKSLRVNLCSGEGIVAAKNAGEKMGMAVKKIVPRWEWRTFRHSFGPRLDLLRDRELGNYKESREIYILSRASNSNIKVRNQTLEVKTLQAVNEAKLEQWCPVIKACFPLTREQMVSLADYLKTRIAVLDGAPMTLEKLLRFADNRAVSLKTVQVEKRRYIYVIEQCIVEYVRAVAGGRAFSSICVEHVDPARVAAVVKSLKLDDCSNISYVKALKAWFF